ncbi:MAG: helix-turn-helix domain-containing protein [Candidatus Odinarchaeota archaeon]
MPLHGTANNIVKKLVELGFTAYEAKVYLVLSTEGSLNPTEIADKSGVPRPNVYRVLEKLEAEGYARREAVPRGARYLAVSPEEVAEKIEQRLKDKEIAVKELKTLIKEIKPAEIVSASETMWLVNGVEEIKKLVEKSIVKSERELIILSPPLFGQETVEEKKIFLEKLIRRVNMGLNLIIGWPINRDDIHIAKELMNKATVYHWSLGEVPMGIYCSDGKECLITFIGKWAPLISYDLGLWIRNPIYVKPIEYLASKLLTITKPAEERINELMGEQ